MLVNNSNQNLSRQKKERIDKAIKDGGYYGKNGVWNSIIVFPGDPTIYRERVETIVVRDGKFVFVKRKPDGSYFLPGGSTEKSRSHIEQAESECNEEARIKIKNIKFTGLTYKASHSVPEWVKRDKFDIAWDGTYNEIFIAEYDGKYEGHIDSADLDKFIGSGQWYNVKDCIRFFTKEHRMALSNYLKNWKEQQSTTVKESYISNYFTNKKMLKDISNNVDIERSAVEVLISTLTKSYLKLSGKSNIRRERKSPNVSSIFHPVASIDFDDRCTITFAISFDDSETSPSAAYHTHEYGNVVTVYPNFFNTKKECQIFCILHEIGHVRLHHLEYKNRKCDIFGNDRYLDYRISKIRKGKVMYPESNADLYALLNGGKLYALQDISSNKNDEYKLSNDDISNRYNNLFKKYSKLAYEDSISRYDISCTAIYENIEDIGYLDNQSKDMLYTICYEYTIHNKIKDDERYKKLSEIYKKKQAYFNEIKDTLSQDERDDYQDDLNDIYMELLTLKSILYDNHFKSDEIDTAYGNNNLAKYVSKTKKLYNQELIDTLDSIAENLKNENAENSKKYLYLIESLTQAQRDKIPTKKFGIEETRSFPLDTPKRVRSAVTLFNKAPNKYKMELARKIMKAIDKFNIDITIGKDTELHRYIEKIRDE